MAKFTSENRPTSGEFKAGDPNMPVGGRGRGRPSKLEDPSYCKLVAAEFVAGKSRADMSASFGVSESTITVWRRDPRVKAHERRLIDERLRRVVNRLDAVLEHRVMQESDNLTVDEVLKIRKELFGGSMREEVEGKADAATTEEAIRAIDSDPELVNKLNALLAANGEKIAEALEEE